MVDCVSAVGQGADLLVHYGHSCLVPIDSCVMPVGCSLAASGLAILHLKSDCVNFPGEILGRGGMHNAGEGW